MRAEMIIFYPTSRCNSKCITCYYWDELNKEGDLTFEEIDRLTQTLPRINELWLSGGEPIMRKDLVEVLKLFIKRCHLRRIRLPVNGLLPDRTEEVVDGILDIEELPYLDVNVSIDGFQETHDTLRGVPGNYEKSMITLERLQEKRQKRMRLFVNTVICRDNVDEVVQLGESFYQDWELDGHYFQIIRGNPMEPGLKEVPSDKLRDIYRASRDLNFRYIDKNWKGVSRLFLKGGYTEAYQIQYSNFTKGNDWPMLCTAARNAFVIYPRGDVASCELRPALGNLREHDMDFGKLFEEEVWDKEKKAIPQDRCYCTHICFIHASMKSQKKELASLPLIHLKTRNDKDWLKT